MRAFIFTEGSSKIGFGHITRCIALAQAFKERRVKVKLIVNADSTLKDILKFEDYEVANWLKKKEYFSALLNKQDIAVIDSYLAGIDFYKSISEKIGIALYLDDFKRFNYPAGIVVNNALSAESLCYPKRQAVTYLLGSKYTPLRKEFWDVADKRINKEISSIMVIFGGTDGKNMTEKILRLLVDKYPGVDKNVVIGAPFGRLENIERIKDSRTKIINSLSAESIKKVMLRSDIAISASGQTLYELARTGTPTIAVSVAVNQLNNIKGLHRAGFIKCAGWYNDKDLSKNIAKCIDGFKGKDKRAKSCLSARRVIDGKGAVRIAEEALK